MSISELELEVERYRRMLLDSHYAKKEIQNGEWSTHSDQDGHRPGGGGVLLRPGHPSPLGDAESTPAVQARQPSQPVPAGNGTAGGEAQRVPQGNPESDTDRSGGPGATSVQLAPFVLQPPLKLDLGCGKNKKESFLGVDCLDFPGVDYKVDLGSERWPWEDSSVDEAHCSHMLEHLVPKERIHFANELWRVLKPDGKALIVVPHWASCRAYGDLTHQWPPVSEFWPPYLQKKWREENAPHNSGYECNFDCLQPGYSMHPELLYRNDHFRTLALQFGKEAALDMIFTLVCRK